MYHPVLGSLCTDLGLIGQMQSPSNLTSAPSDPSGGSINLCFPPLPADATVTIADGKHLFLLWRPLSSISFVSADKKAILHPNAARIIHSAFFATFVIRRGTESHATPRRAEKEREQNIPRARTHKMSGQPGTRRRRGVRQGENERGELVCDASPI